MITITRTVYKRGFDMLTVKDLRNSYLKFFEERGHRVVPSSSLIPKDDPTLLFTTAGMVQFKPMFAGTVDLEYTRAATVQKCLRTSDLEEVGRTKRHCTFFEMLGNFSFGDYFKKEAIEWSWEYSVNVIGFKPETIWISIYQEDDEAFEIWNKHIGVPAERIVRLGKEDNFWGPAGDTGACGPCSELHLDRGEEYGCGSADCKPGCNCERFMEYWNLVFNQFFQDENGELTPLPQTGIDTGMGLERLATLVQGVDSIYDTDELKSMVNFVCEETGTKYEADDATAVNVIVEHARALTFAISDGAYPSNEGRGYVLRRILRRALRYGRQIGIKKPFVYRMVDPLVEIMGDHYPEIRKAAPNVKELLKGEEERFLETLENGMQKLEEILANLEKTGSDTMSGKDVFLLYDTFGFPMEMTIEMAAEKNLKVDTEGFETEMEKQRERGKKSWKSGESGYEKIFEELSREAGVTDFRGYDADYTDSSIIIMHNMEKRVSTLKEGERGIIVTPESTFYGEAGGQVGDRGLLYVDDNTVFEVQDTKKINNTIMHLGVVKKGSMEEGDRVTLQVDSVRRNLTRANHTATHLLQASLKNIIGEHVQQAGSLVEPDRFRFDFSHFKQMSDEEIGAVEDMVNRKIWENLPVETQVRQIDEAIKMGAVAVFDEKYEDTVRVVKVDDFSMELCGGTHVDNTGKIGVFKILREGSPGAGMRRIEAVTLKGMYERFLAQQKILEQLTASLNVTEQAVPEKVHDILEQNRALEKEMSKKKKSGLKDEAEKLIQDGIDVNGLKVITATFKDMSVDEMRSLSDMIRSKSKESVLCLGSAVKGKAMLLCAATEPAVQKGIDCNALIRDISKIVGGGGGGRKDMAQAGGKSPEHLGEAVQKSVESIRGMLG